VAWANLFAHALLASAILTFSSCKPAPTNPPQRQTAAPRVASLVPAATDLLIGMGAANHLLAVSHYDPPREEIRNLPRVGDYQNLDWEQLASLRPDLMVVFMAPDRIPEGLRQRAQQLNIRLLNIRTERLEDIFTETRNLGDAIHEPEKAAAAIQKLRGRLDAVRRRVQDKPRPRTLLVRERTADAVVGRDNFLDDILTIAGGDNVITSTGWPTIDRERLLSLKPNVIIQLLPDASPQVVQDAQQLWRSMPQIPAVQNHRVHILTEWYAQQSGSHVADLAEKFATILHPEPAP
jgi:iron complex transport system substrate-binding protein